MHLYHKAAAILSLAFLAGSYAAWAASPVATAAVNARKANYKEIGGAFKTINDELKSGAPDMNSVRPLARDIATRSALQLKYFPKGSGPESGLKTRAKAAIWSDNAAFVKLQNDMVSASKALNAAAESGNGSALASARTTLGGLCKSCHDRFREAD
ncbi:c-type cytochrome [Sphingobium sp. CAP-1]|uniref:c-type cytochrome n=1 Tax=Sphingobium sp. CAP-1 TaxID=2676077 RepID=UPI0012BB2403|nr:cytochrome c [Sphingobium sp. CAP-1]QGP81120.1 cytochrome c [Sphingobium sp. CAP-1]